MFVTECNAESILDAYEKRKSSLEDEEKMISVEKDNKEDKQKT